MTFYLYALDEARSLQTEDMNLIPNVQNHNLSQRRGISTNHFLCRETILGMHNIYNSLHPYVLSCSHAMNGILGEQHSVSLWRYRPMFITPIRLGKGGHKIFKQLNMVAHGRLH